MTKEVRKNVTEEETVEIKIYKRPRSHIIRSQVILWGLFVWFLLAVLVPAAKQVDSVDLDKMTDAGKAVVDELGLQDGQTSDDVLIMMCVGSGIVVFALLVLIFITCRGARRTPCLNKTGKGFLVLYLLGGAVHALGRIRQTKSVFDQGKAATFTSDSLADAKRTNSVGRLFFEVGILALGLLMMMPDFGWMNNWEDTLDIRTVKRKVKRSVVDEEATKEKEREAKKEKEEREKAKKEEEKQKKEEKKEREAREKEEKKERDAREKERKKEEDKEKQKEKEEKQKEKEEKKKEEEKKQKEKEEKQKEKEEKQKEKEEKQKEKEEKQREKEEKKKEKEEKKKSEKRSFRNLRKDESPSVELCDDTDDRPLLPSGGGSFQGEGMPGRADSGMPGKMDSGMPGKTDSGMPGRALSSGGPGSFSRNPVASPRSAKKGGKAASPRSKKKPAAETNDLEEPLVPVGESTEAGPDDDI